MANYLSDYSFKGTVVNVWLLQLHYHEQSCVFDIVRKKNFFNKNILGTQRCLGY